MDHLELLENLTHLTKNRSTMVENSHRPITERVFQMSEKKLHQRILRATGKAIGDFKMIEDQDKILVAISGGKDSWVMLKMLKELQAKAPIEFEIVAINIDQGYQGFRQDLIEDYVEDEKIDYQMEEFDIASILSEKIDAGDTPCSLCARLRRGSLYGLAEKHGCNKIALGHHLDDLIETLLLNAFYGGRLASMAPKLKSDDRKNTVIRPLCYVSEAEIREYANKSDFPIVCCKCPLMCGQSTEIDSKRQMVKNMLNILEKSAPDIRYSLLRSLTNVHPSHLLDQKIWDFHGMSNES